MFADIAKKGAGARSPNKGFLIADAAVGDKLVGQVAVVRRDLRQTKAGKPYLSLLLSDRTGQLEARDWDNALQNEPIFEPGTIVKVQGRVEDFNGQAQLIVERARTCKEAEFERADFIPASGYDLDELLAALRETVAGLANEWLRRLLTGVLERHAAALRNAPAAMRLHHPYIGGLLEHVLSMCRAAAILCGHYTRLDRDLLVAGCVLHDIGKVRELEAGIAIDYSVPGRLVGHVAEGLIILEDCCREIEGFPDELKMVLRHLILSHHGHMEYGALKLPMTPEAIALYFIDDLDAKLEHAFRLIDASGPEAEFSAYERSLGREIYCVRGKPADDSDAE